MEYTTQANFETYILPANWQETPPISPYTRCFATVRNMHIMVGIELHNGKRWRHFSVSYRSRCPIYPELQQVRRIFAGHNNAAVHVFPPDKEKVNVHPYCLHLFSPLDGELTDSLPIEWRNQLGDSCNEFDQQIRSFWKKKRLRIAVTTREFKRNSWRIILIGRNDKYPKHADLTQVKRAFVGKEQVAYQVFPPDTEEGVAYSLFLYAPQEHRPLPDFRREDGMI
jgi:hypothetical protein